MRAARPVLPSVLAREVPDLAAVDPDRHGVRVVRIVSLGNQHSAHRHTHPLLRIAAAASELPEILLVERLADYF